MTAASGTDPATDNQPIKGTLQDQLKFIRTTLGDSSDLIVREMILSTGARCAVAYIEGITDSLLLYHTVISALLDLPNADSAGELSKLEPEPFVRYLSDRVLAAGDVRPLDDWNTLFFYLLSGNAILLVDGSPTALRIGVIGFEERAVSEPVSQSVTRGSMDAFNENIETGMSLLRRKIRDTRLRFDRLQVGRVTKTALAVVYLKGIAKDEIVAEVHRRLAEIDIDGILEGGYVEELIQDRTYTPFPTVFNSERPDTIAGGILEGKVAILVNGTPFVLLVPALFVEFFQAAEDYSQRFDISTLIRFIRYLSFFITTLAPALYVAISTFHQEMLPTNLLINLAAQREGVPFPAVIEAMAMEVTYEILREAGIRMPRTVGQAVSIVGTLVIGQAAVQAGIVSAAMVIIVSITAIASYVIPAGSMSMSARMLRFLFMILAASFGLLGVVIGLIGLALHLSGLRSFGVPYMSPLSPIILSDQKDTLFRAPWSLMKLRPRLVASDNNQRRET
ncbi:spore germination protein [Cohnella thailandensis]|uniref:Spore germination protein n=1 Tax=Cohnella thailandensis TaxID=557557 RepID=A0A841T3W1_9BACL|nr:spore germination protein [Cohnella thailandensis]MBB6637325.1 spore germination protein [Cohnella thailandensis]MBP1976653.1 spore germination protein KA [Cohnella thailandensis]